MTDTARVVPSEGRITVSATDSTLLTRTSNHTDLSRLFTLATHHHAIKYRALNIRPLFVPNFLK